MRIYLDTCCLQRPLDDQTQPRIRVETEATSVKMAARLENVQAADNFRNLFEVPVLFYGLVK